MKFKQLISKVRQMIETDELRKRNNSVYSEASKKTFLASFKVIEEESEDFETYPEKWADNFRSNLQKRGVEKTTENYYLGMCVWLFKTFADLGHHVNYRPKDFARQNETDKMIVPDNSKVMERMSMFKPSKTQEDSFKYILAALYTAARYSDMVSWDQSNLVIKNSRLYLSYVPKKTSRREIIIPVSDELASCFNPSGKLLPEIDYQKLNRDVKSIFNDAGFHDLVTRKRKVGDKIVSKEYELWELMGIHRLRACAITGMLESGLTESDVKAFSGHSYSSKAFDRYVHLSTNHLDQAYQKYQNR